MPASLEVIKQCEEGLANLLQKEAPRINSLAGNIGYKNKDDKTPVTELDLEIEVLAKEVLSGIDSSFGFEGEEHDIEGSRDTYWLIDPIDGTEQMIRGIDAYRFMATLVDEGALRYTFVFDIPRGDIFTAIKVGGAFMNGEPLKLSDRPADRSVIELTSNLRLPETGKIIAAVRDQIRGIRMTADHTLTPRGKFEGHLYYKASGSTWDWAPFALLIKEAGGKVANFGSDGYDFKNPNFLAATPECFDLIKPIIDKVFSEEGLL